MLFLSVDDFFQKARGAKLPSREEEKRLALQMQAGDADARRAIVKGYLPLVASFVKRSPRELQTLQTVYCCLRCLEESVDNFRFLGEGESFLHHLSGGLRRCMITCMARRC